MTDTEKKITEAEALEDNTSTTVDNAEIKPDANGGKTPAKEKPKKAKERTDKAPKRGPGWFAYCLLVIAFGGLIGVLYIGVKHGYKTKTALETEIVQLREEIQSLDGSTTRSLANTQSSIEKKVKHELQQTKIVNQKTQSDLIARVNELNKRLDGHQQRLVSLSTTSKEDWLLAEAEYLLKLANQRVLLENSPTNALALLNEADAIIHRVSAGLGDHELHAIRESIARELIALRAVKVVDREGIYLKLAAIAEGVDNINTIPEFHIDKPSEDDTAPALIETPPAVADAPTPDEAQDSWFQKFKHEFKKTGKIITEKYIRIQDKNDLTQPTVSQRTLHLMHLNVRMLLEQAQLALLKQDQTLYNYSIKQAQTLFVQYYSPAAPEYSLLEEIAALENINIAPALPDISKSLKLLHDFVEEQHRINPQSPKKQLQVGGVSP